MPVETPMAQIATIPDECPICGESKSVALRKGRYVTQYNKLSITLENVESYCCEACKEVFFSKEQEKELSHRVKEAARAMLGGLPPERIIALRQRLGLSQEEFEALLDLGPKVVTRWENGHVIPSRTTTYLLRLLERMPQLVDEIRAVKRECEGGG
jgi:HTH-type transcriptional regulator/antitoxin MqsA